MFVATYDDVSINFETLADKSHVARVVSRGEGFLLRAGYRDISGLKLLLRELLAPLGGQPDPYQRKSVIHCGICLINENMVELTIRLAQGRDWGSLLNGNRSGGKIAPDRALLSAVAEEMAIDDSGASLMVRVPVGKCSSFDIEHDEGRSIIRAVGRLDASTAREMCLLLLEQLHNCRRNFVLDLGDVGSIDSEFTETIGNSPECRLISRYHGIRLELINAGAGVPKALDGLSCREKMNVVII